MDISLSEYAQIINWIAKHPDAVWVFLEPRLQQPVKNQAENVFQQLQILAHKFLERTCLNSSGDLKPVQIIEQNLTDDSENADTFKSLLLDLVVQNTNLLNELKSQAKEYLSKQTMQSNTIFNNNINLGNNATNNTTIINQAGIINQTIEDRQISSIVSGLLDQDLAKSIARELNIQPKYDDKLLTQKELTDNEIKLISGNSYNSEPDEAIFDENLDDTIKKAEKNEEEKTILDKNIEQISKVRASDIRDLAFLYLNKKLYQKALICFYKAWKKDPENLDTLENLAQAYNVNGNNNEAIAFFRLLLSKRKIVLGKNDIDVAKCYNQLGILYDKLAHHTVALEYYQKDLDITLLWKEENSIDVAESYNNIGLSYYGIRDLRLAEHYLLKSFNLKKRLSKDDDLLLTSILANLGIVYKSMGYFEKALEFYYEDYRISSMHLSARDPNIAISLNNLGECYLSLGDFFTALKYFKRAYNIYRRAYQRKNHPDIALVFNNVGVTLDRQGNLDRALKYYQKVLDIRKVELGQQHPYTAISYHNLADLEFRTGQYVEALKHFQSALSIYIMQQFQDLPAIGGCHFAIGSIYKIKGEKDKAKSHFLEAKTLFHRLNNIDFLQRIDFELAQIDNT